MLTVHPLATRLPSLSEQEEADLKADIKRNGLREPILISNGQILDGKNRYWACNEVGVKPHFVEYTGPTDDFSITQLIVSLNVMRRHLTKSQRSAVAANMLDVFINEAHRRKSTGGARHMQLIATPGAIRGAAIELAGKRFGVNREYVRCARAVKQKIPHVFKSLLEGQISLREAHSMLNIGKSRNEMPPAPKCRLGISLPVDAKHVLCIWGDSNQLDKLRAMAGEHCIQYVEADRTEGNKWVPKKQEAVA